MTHEEKDVKGLALETPEEMYGLDDLKENFPISLLSPDENAFCRVLANDEVYINVVKYIKKIHPELGLKECKIYYDLYLNPKNS